MNIIILIICAICIIVGVIGCFLPVVPGLPLLLIPLVLMKFTEYGANLSWVWFFIFFAVVTAETFLEYIFQTWGAKKFGASRAGIISAFAGTLAGLFFLPLGIIICPFFGAFLGELIAGASARKSLKAACGTFIGFLLGFGLRFAVCVCIIFYLFINLQPYIKP
jgi:uncharacterized protein YqgC (DUF456 family)